MKTLILCLSLLLAAECQENGYITCHTEEGTCMDRRKHCCSTGFTDEYACTGSVHNKCCLPDDRFDICHPERYNKNKCRKYGGVCRHRSVTCSSEYVEGLCDNSRLGCCFPETECERRGGRCVNATKHHCPKKLEQDMCFDDDPGYGCCVNYACGKTVHDLACSILSGSTLFHGMNPQQQGPSSAYQNVVDTCFGSRARTDPSCPVRRVCLHRGVLQLIECLEGICDALQVKWIASGCDEEYCFIPHCKGNAIAFKFPEHCDPEIEVDTPLLYGLCRDLGGDPSTNHRGYITCIFNELQY